MVGADRSSINLLTGPPSTSGSLPAANARVLESATSGLGVMGSRIAGGGGQLRNRQLHLLLLHQILFSENLCFRLVILVRLVLFQWSGPSSPLRDGGNQLPLVPSFS